MAIVIGFPDSRTGDLLRELLEGEDVIIEWCMLAGGLQAVGEDIPGNWPCEVVRGSWE